MSDGCLDRASCWATDLFRHLVCAGLAGYTYYIEDGEDIGLSGGILDGGGDGILALNTEVLAVAISEIDRRIFRSKIR